MRFLSFRHTFLPSGSMKITEARVSDSGMYLCVATNIAGNVTQSVKLSVHGEFWNEGVDSGVLASGSSIFLVSLIDNLQFVHSVIREKFSKIWGVIFFHWLWKVYLPSVNNSPLSLKWTILNFWTSIVLDVYSDFWLFLLCSNKNVFRLVAFWSEGEFSRENLIVVKWSFPLFKGPSNWEHSAS